MINPRVKFTYRDYMSLPESDEKQYELIEGELYMVPGPIPLHQDVVFVLAMILYNFVQPRGLGKVYVAPLDVVLSDTDVVQPDIIFISNSRLSIITERNIRGAPDLVVEVLSPGRAEYDRLIKRARYARFGVREYWIVDPQARTIEVLKAGDEGFETVRVYPEGTRAASPLLKGLRVNVSSIFA
jgi:Uma2 family endonuclease